MRASRCGAMTSATRVVESDDPRFVPFSSSARARNCETTHGGRLLAPRFRGTPGRACERARRHAAEDDPLETSDEHLGATRVDRVGGSSDGPRGVVPRGAISRTPAPGLDAGRTPARGDGDRARVRRLHGQVPRDGRLRPRLHGQGGGHATLGCARPPAPRDRRARRNSNADDARSSRPPPRALIPSPSPLPSSPAFPLAAEAEFVAAFDSLLRNNRDQVPPQYFYERLLHILARRRDPVDPRTGVPAPPDADRATTSAPEDDRLVRATVDIFRRVFAARPASSLGRFPGAGAGDDASFVRVESLTWTPLDSDRRARGHDAGAEHRAAPKMHERGANADWCRFRALTRAAGGDPTDLDALCEPPDVPPSRRRRDDDWDDDREGGGDGDDRAETRKDDRAARANRRAGGDTANANANAKRSRDDENGDARLGATLLWLHACDVFVADADARVATFETRVARRAASKHVSDAAMESPLDDADSPVPDSQPSPGGDGDARDGTWAAGVLRGSLLYRLVVDHVPSDADRAKFFEETLHLACVAATRAAAEAERFEDEGGGDGDGSSRRLSRRRRANDSTASVRIAPGREDVSPESVSAAAHRLLSRLGNLLDGLERAGADRAAGKIRVALEDATTRAYRFHRGLADVDAKRAFLAHFAGPPTHELRLVRSVFRATVMARQAPGIMRPGLGSSRGASGATDVFEYVARDARTAIRTQKDSEGSADHAESVARTALAMAAAARAAAWMLGEPDAPETRACAGSFRAANDAFLEEAGKDGEPPPPRVAAALDAAAGALRAA